MSNSDGDEHPELPIGWMLGTLNDVSDIQSGSGFPETYQGETDGDYPFVKVADVSWSYLNHNKMLETANNYISEKIRIELKVKTFPPDSILFAKIGEAVKLNRRVITMVPVCADNNVMGLIPYKNYFNPYYIFYYMNTIELYDYSQATTVPSVRKSSIQDIEIPLPPLPEQHRIVAKIESLFQEVKTARENLKKVQPIIHRFRQSVLAAAFVGELVPQNPNDEPASVLLERIKAERKKKLGKKYKELELVNTDGLPELPEGWEYEELGNLIYIAARIGWRGLKAEEYTPDGPLFLSVYNLNKGRRVDYGQVNHISRERYIESPEIQLKNDDILLVKDGAGIGKIGIVKELETEATINSSLLLIRSAEALTPEFLFYFLSGPAMQKIVKEKITGSATPHLFQRDIKQFRLLIPPLPEQHRIVAKIEQLFTLADQVEQSLQKSKKRADKLEQAILAKAFRGELVPQDPKDEPASVLLERIRKEREKLESNKKSRRKNA